MVRFSYMNMPTQLPLMPPEENIVPLLIEILSEIQELSGQETPDIDEDTCPVGDLQGFDSLNFVEMVSMLSERLGVEFNPIHLLETKNGRSVSVLEIASRITKLPTT